MVHELRAVEDPIVEAVSEGRQSPNWHVYQDTQGFIEDGFPFREGFPPTSMFEAQPYDLILRDGSRVVGYVDFSTQYRAEGLSWMNDKRGSIAHQQVVVGWKIHEEPNKPSL